MGPPVRGQTYPCGLPANSVFRRGLGNGSSPAYVGRGCLCRYSGFAVAIPLMICPSGRKAHDRNQLLRLVAGYICVPFVIMAVT